MQPAKSLFFKNSATVIIFCAMPRAGFQSVGPKGAKWFERKPRYDAARRAGMSNQQIKNAVRNERNWSKWRSQGWSSWDSGSGWVHREEQEEVRVGVWPPDEGESEGRGRPRSRSNSRPAIKRTESARALMWVPKNVPSASRPTSRISSVGSRRSMSSGEFNKEIEQARSKGFSEAAEKFQEEMRQLMAVQKEEMAEMRKMIAAQVRGGPYVSGVGGSIGNPKWPPADVCEEEEARESAGSSSHDTRSEKRIDTMTGQESRKREERPRHQHPKQTDEARPDRTPTSLRLSFPLILP